MTNAEKFLKYEVDKKKFVEEIIKINNDWRMRDITLENVIIEWLQKPIKPTLSEDERVILRNIKPYTHIRRTDDGELRIYCYTTETSTSGHSMSEYNHLFQFIKDGEEYEIAELLKGE